MLEVVGAMAMAKFNIDQALTGQFESKVRINLANREISGRMICFDGERMAIEDDLDIITVVYLKSGVAITTTKSMEDASGSED